MTVRTSAAATGWFICLEFKDSLGLLEDQETKEERIVKPSTS